MAHDFFHLLEEYCRDQLDPEVRNRIEQIASNEPNEFGVDSFGFDAKTLFVLAPFMFWLYKKYFRCETYGVENIPDGRMMVVSNHSGQLPFDGAMLISSFILEPKLPRLLRGMVEKWVCEIPFFSTLLSRAGQVIGTPSTCKALLEQEEAVIVFPEGVKGIAKLFTERYKLAHFGSGFVRVALLAKSPIVPVAVIGAEEQAPAIANLAPMAKKLGMPALPLVFPQLLPLPLPVKYRIYIGKPLYFNGDGTEDEQEIRAMVQQVKSSVKDLINLGLSKRKNIFF